VLARPRALVSVSAEDVYRAEPERAVAARCLDSRRATSPSTRARTTSPFRTHVHAAHDRALHRPPRRRGLRHAADEEPRDGSSGIAQLATSSAPIKGLVGIVGACSRASPPPHDALAQGGARERRASATSRARRRQAPRAAIRSRRAKRSYDVIVIGSGLAG
jgi:hypothetical protein